MTTRRRFIGLTAGLLGATAIPLSSHAEAGAVIMRSTRMSRDFADGVSMGLEEMISTARLLRREITIHPSDSAPENTIVLSDASAAVAIGAGGSEGLHVLPDPTRRAAMLTKWRAANPGVVVTDLVAWAPDLYKYGATQLNQRYETRLSRGMSELAWAGWISAKIACEAILRHEEPALQVRAIHVDGHKGIPLFFDDAETLVQPMFAIEIAGSERRVHEVAPEGLE